MRQLAKLTLLLCLASTVTPWGDAQNITIPDSWQDPQVRITVDKAEDLIQSVLSSVNPYINASRLINGPQTSLTVSGIFAYSAATSDLLASRTDNRLLVLGAVENIGSGVTNYSSSAIDAGMWGLAAINAFRAYNDSDSLEIAEAAWNSLNAIVLSTDPHHNATPTGVSLADLCHGSTILGAPFSSFAAGVSDVSGLGAGLFLSLSASLHEATENDSFRLSAEMAASFIQTQLYNGTFVEQDIELKNCFVSSGIYSHATGAFIEGLSVLAQNNFSWIPLLREVVLGAVPWNHWTYDESGIILEGITDPDDEVLLWSKTIFVRGLFSAWMRSNDTELRNYIEAFLSVQYNALLKLATYPGTNTHGAIWEGPAPTGFSVLAQVVALDVLNAGYAFAQPDSDLDNAHKTAPIGAIVGGVIAGIAVLAAALVILVLRLRKRRLDSARVQQQLEQTAVPFEISPQPAVTPAMMTQLHSASFTRLPLASSSQTNLNLSEKRVMRSATSAGASGPSSSIAAFLNANASMTSLGAGSSSGSALPSFVPPDASGRVAPSADVVTVPGLVDTLDRILARLPRGGVDGEEPPEYGE